MGVLSFRRKVETASEEAHDWSQQELADFFRAHNLLTQNGVNIGMDRGLSDQGEPWMVFFDPASLDVFMHVARIDTECVLICEPLSIKITARDIGGLIEQFEERVRQYLDIRSERASNVVLHPAARIIMSISAVFLLFKLDNASQTYAREMGGAGGGADGRKDGIVTTRVQSVMARLFDAVDNPVAIAALAGMILASDLLHQAGGEQLGANLLDAELIDFSDIDSDSIALSRGDASDIDAFRATIDGEGTNGAQPVDAAAAEAMTTAQKIDLAAAQMTVPASTGIDGDFRVETSRVPEATPDEGSQSAKSGSDKSSEAAAAPAPTASEPAASTDGGSKSGDADASSSDSASADSGEAEEVLRGMYKWDWASLDKAKPIIVSLDGKDGNVSLGAGESSRFSIDFDTMDEAFATVGFAAETALTVIDLQDLLAHIVSGLGDFEVASNAGKLLIEQHAVDGLDADEVGMWTNTMSDGSSISIVGTIDLIDDVGQHLLT